jgi:hypothetical protein
MTIGGVTYTTVICPVCGATLRLGTQAVSPAYTYPATCPYDGFNFGTQVVSLEVLTPPTNPAYVPRPLDIGSDINDQVNNILMMNSMMNMIMMVMMMSIVMSMMKPLMKGI